MTPDASAPISENADGTVTVIFDARVYVLDAIKKAAYKFAKDCSIILASDEDKFVATVTSFDPNADNNSRTRLVGAFCNEVIDQELREKIAIQTEPMRNLILAQAFSKTNLLNDG